MNNPNLEQINLKKAMTSGTLFADICFHEDDTVVSASKSINPHIHSCFEIYLNVSGDLSFAVENNVYPVTCGDIIITKPNEFHHAIIHKDCVHKHCCLWLDADNELSHIFSFIADRKNGENNLISMPASKKEEVISHFKSLNDAKDISDISGLASLFGILSILSSYHNNTVPSIKLPDELSEILKYIDENYADNCDTNYLAEHFFISRSTLSRQFKKHLNISPSKYVETRRLSAAKDLLEQGTSVQSVYSKCGFSDYSHFIALFRKRLGITPYKYSKKFTKKGGV